MTKPFLKWVGGKRQLISELEIRIPDEINTYYEPFIGGGALLLHLKPQRVVIGDFNKDLICTYNTIKNDLPSLVNELQKYELNHSKSPKEFYYSIREMDRIETYKSKSELEIAARFMYLNKSCFNGLYRVNSKNYFNVPWNKKDRVTLYSQNNLESVSNYFNSNDVSIINGDFEKIVSTAVKGDFIYFDPPYDVLDSNTFDSYSKDGFGREGQKRLAKVFKELDDRGCKVLLSNHNTELINKLYGSYNIDVVKATRKVNSNAGGRGLMEEVLIYNYNLTGEKMREKQFEDIIMNLKETIATPSYFCDFEKVVNNVEEIEDGLNLLNSLIGATNPSEKLKSLLEKYGKTVSIVLPILHAVRVDKKKYISVLNTENLELMNINFKGDEINIDDILYFCEKTGLFKFLKEEKITNINSYVSGVEIGLDSNARKNRTGTTMESLVEGILSSDESIKEVHSQIKPAQIDVLYGTTFEAELNAYSEKAIKQFDFAFEYNNTIYVVETNFYSGGGSKLNETARSFLQLENDIKKIDGIEFIWITDGIGWRSARNNLKETYNNNKHVYTLAMLEHKTISQLIKKTNK